jgi:hypothetical protein
MPIMDALGQLGTADVTVTEAIFRSTNTLDPRLLRDPALVEKVAAWRAEGRRPEHTDPARPPLLAMGTPGGAW